MIEVRNYLRNNVPSFVRSLSSTYLTLMCPGFRKSGYGRVPPGNLQNKVRATRMGVLNRNRSGASGDSFFIGQPRSSTRYLGSGPCINVREEAAAGPISRGPDGDQVTTRYCPLPNVALFSRASGYPRCTSEQSPPCATLALLPNCVERLTPVVFYKDLAGNNDCRALDCVLTA